MKRKSIVPVSPITKKIKEATSPTTQTTFSDIQHAFSTSRTQIYSRDTENNQIYAIIEKHIMAPSNQFLYISGQPGTGKTATIQHNIERFTKLFPKVSINLINGMLFKGELELQRDVIFTLLGKEEMAKHEIDEKSLISKDTLRAIAVDGSKKVLIIDEIDIIAKGKQIDLSVHNIIYDIPILCPNVLLIGISNSTKFYAPLESFFKCQAKEISTTHIVFEPYNAAQIEDIISSIIKSSLKDKTVDDFIDKEAIKLCAIKCCSSGDIRMALEICRTVFAEAKEKINLASMQSSIDKKFKNNVGEILKSLGREQQIIAFAAYQKTSNGIQTMTLNKLHDEIKSVISKLSLNALQFKDVLQSIDILQFYGVISYTKDNKNIAKSQIQYLLNLDQSKVAFLENALFSELI